MKVVRSDIDVFVPTRKYVNRDIYLFLFIIEINVAYSAADLLPDDDHGRVAVCHEIEADKNGPARDSVECALEATSGASPRHMAFTTWPSKMANGYAIVRFRSDSSPRIWVNCVDG